MATAADVRLVRLNVNDLENKQFENDDDIENLLDANESVVATSALLWSVIAGRLYRKVDLGTSQTKLDLEAQFEHAKAMAEHYADMAGGLGALTTGSWESITMAPADDDSLQMPENMDGFWSQWFWGMWPDHWINNR